MWTAGTWSPVGTRTMCCRLRASRGLRLLFHSFGLSHKYETHYSVKLDAPGAANHVPCKVKRSFCLNQAFHCSLWTCGAELGGMKMFIRSAFRWHLRLKSADVSNFPLDGTHVTPSHPAWITITVPSLSYFSCSKMKEQEKGTMPSSELSFRFDRKHIILFCGDSKHFPLEWGRNLLIALLFWSHH